jgi:serine protease Do
MSTVHTDQFTDLAVMKIDAKGLPAAKIGDAGKLRIGDWVVAIGNSLGQGIRATQGIVCRKEASLDAGQGQTLSGLIETDAAINPGNSGGPLVNMTGEVIGITSAKIAQVGVEGVGYAISINEALPIIRDLMSTGYVVRPWLGVGMYTVDAWAVFRYRLTTDKGVLVTQVVSPGPASTAGLQAGDVIVKFNGQDITESAQLMSAILKAKIGQEVEVVFWRGSNQKTTKAVIAESPKQQ